LISGAFAHLQMPQQESTVDDREQVRHAEPTIGGHGLHIAQPFHRATSTVLAPADFFLFPRLKSIMKGARFPYAAALQGRVTVVMRLIAKRAIADSFQQLYERCQKCVVTNADYFEGE
jgi:hypothetical protein